MPKGLVRVNDVAITAPFLVSGENAGFLKMSDDAHGGAFRNANTAGNIPHPRARIFRQAD